MSRAGAVAAGVALLAPGVALLGAALRHWRARRAFLAGSAVASGRVVGFEERRDGDPQSGHFARVSFRTGAGREITFVSEVGSEIPSERVGDALRVRNRPESPLDAEVDEFWALWGVTTLLAVLGLAFLAIGLGLVAGWIPV